MWRLVLKIDPFFSALVCCRDSIFRLFFCLGIACACFQGEEFAAITPKRLQIPPVSSGSVMNSKIIRDMDKKPNPDVRN